MDGPELSISETGTYQKNVGDKKSVIYYQWSMEENGPYRFGNFLEAISADDVRRHYFMAMDIYTYIVVYVKYKVT